MIFTSADDARVACPLFHAEYGGSNPTSARHLLINKCSVKTACELNRLWHSRFPIIDWSNVVRNQDYVCFVAEYSNIYYAVAIWSSPICAHAFKNGKEMLELRRMAIASDAPKNTATRMLMVMRRSIFKSFQHIKTLISYQDTEAHNGTIYKAGGWTPVSRSGKPTWNKSRIRSNPQSFSDKIRWEYQIRK